MESGEEWVVLEEWEKVKFKRKEVGEIVGWILREVKMFIKVMVIFCLKYRDLVSNVLVRKCKGVLIYIDNLC